MNENNLKNIGIIMGGYSHEYEISIKSGMVVYKTLKEHYNCYRILINERSWSLIDEKDDLYKIDAEVGSKISLNCVLLLNKNNDIKFGSPYLSDEKVTATVLKQFNGVKFLVYKMKPKKKMRRKNGFRNKLTRILIDSL